MHEEILRLPYSGVYSLHASVTIALQARFIDSANWTSTSADSPGLQIPLLVESDWSAVSVSISQHSDELEVSVRTEQPQIDVTAVRRQLTKMLSLDVDALSYQSILDGDPITKALGEWNPGLRPVLFPSLYEGAARTIISHRLFANQAAALIQKIAVASGELAFPTSGRRHAFPSPQMLSDLPEIPGLSSQKTIQLRRLGRIVAQGGLAHEVLKSMSREEQLRYLRKLYGIGPFSAELLLLRGVGDHDAFPVLEPKLHSAMRRLYGLAEDANTEVLQELAKRWSPYRSWVGLLFRNAPESLRPLEGQPTKETETATWLAYLNKLTTPELLYRALFRSAAGPCRFSSLTAGSHGGYDA